MSPRRSFAARARVEPFAQTIAAHLPHIVAKLRQVGKCPRKVACFRLHGSRTADQDQARRESVCSGHRSRPEGSPRVFSDLRRARSANGPNSLPCRTKNGTRRRFQRSPPGSEPRDRFFSRRSVRLPTPFAPSSGGDNLIYLSARITWISRSRIFLRRVFLFTPRSSAALI